MHRSAFDLPGVLEQINVKFMVNPPCESLTSTDERGNKTSEGRAVHVRFKLNKPTSREDLDRFGSSDAQRVQAYCLQPLLLPTYINVGHTGLCVFHNRSTDVQILEILDGGASPILNQVLGQKVLLSLIQRSQYGSSR